MAKSKWRLRRGFTLKPQQLPGLVHEIDGISIDFNRVPAADLMALGRKIEAGDIAAASRLVAKVVTAWPWPQPITADGFIGLGLTNIKTTLEALIEATRRVNEKEGK